MCIHCNEIKQVIEFTVGRNVCKSCKNIRQTFLYNNNPEQQKKKARYVVGVKKPKQVINQRSALIHSIINNKLKVRKSSRPSQIKHDVGYNTKELRSHIESLFLDGMTWENRGLWEIDHIKPVSKFINGESIKVINALSNLRPVWRIVNLKKAAKWGDLKNVQVRPSQRPIIAYTINGEILKEYANSLSVAVDGFDPTCVGKVCKNREGRTQHKGVIFKFKEDARS